MTKPVAQYAIKPPRTKAAMPLSSTSLCKQSHMVVDHTTIWNSFMGRIIADG